MRTVQFIDTSVLLEFLDVPGHNGRHAEITAEMERRIAHNVTFVLPVTTIIETGRPPSPNLQSGFRARA